MFEPKCIYHDIAAFTGVQKFATSAQGYLIPCCWMDNHDLPGEETDETHRALFKEHLKLSNVTCVEDILLSDEWITFKKAIQQYETAPPRCQRNCSGQKETKEYI